MIIIKLVGRTGTGRVSWTRDHRASTSRGAPTRLAPGPQGFGFPSPSTDREIGFRCPRGPPERQNPRGSHMRDRRPPSILMGLRHPPGMTQPEAGDPTACNPSLLL